MTKRFFTTSLPAGQHSNGEVLNNATKEMFTNSNSIPGFYPGHSKDLLQEIEVPLLETMEDTHIINEINPFKRVSNVSKTFVEINEYDELMEKHGLKKRGSSKLHLVTHSDQNKKASQYIDHTCKVLNQLENDPELFWKMAFVLARRSPVISALMITELEPNWHRFMNLKELHLLISKYRKFWRETPYQLDYKRVYIPKTIDPATKIVTKVRPLGVPKLVWRAYLHSWNQFLMIFLRNRIPLQQHGFYSGRGTKTAWEQVLKDVKSHKNIYEFDIKGFFPSVNVASVMNKLEEYGTPAHVLDNLYWQGQMPPVLASERKNHALDESLGIFKNELKAVGLLTKDKDWYDFEYTTTSENKLLRTFIDNPSNKDYNPIGYVFLHYNSEGKRYEGPVQVGSFDPTLNTKFPFLFPHINGEYHVYDGEVLRNLFKEHNLNPESVTEESLNKFINLLRQSLRSSTQTILTHFYQSCYEYYGSIVRKGNGYADNHSVVNYEVMRRKADKFATMIPSKEGKLVSFKFGNKPPLEEINQQEEKSKGSVIPQIMKQFWAKQSLISKWIKLTSGKAEPTHSKLNDTVDWKEGYNSSLKLETILEETNSPVLHNKFSKEKEIEGFPQGSPISPILCSSILGDSVFKIAKCLMYADDGLFYSNEPLFGGSDDVTTTPAMKESNLSFAADKSGWVKKDGTWLKPLKFLGLTYDGNTDTLYASTKDKILLQDDLRYDIKKGSTLVFDKGDMIKDFINTQLEAGYEVAGDKFSPEVESYSTEEEFDKSVNAIKLAKYDEVKNKALTESFQRETIFNRITSLGEFYNSLDGKYRGEASRLLTEYFARVLIKFYEEYLPLNLYQESDLSIQQYWPKAIKAITNPGSIGTKEGLRYLCHLRLQVKLFDCVWSAKIWQGQNESRKLDLLRVSILYNLFGLRPTDLEERLTQMKRFIVKENALQEYYNSLGIPQSSVNFVISTILKGLDPEESWFPNSPEFEKIHTFSYESMIESELFGFIQARLYGGDWNTKVEQNFGLTFVPKSWCWYSYLMNKTGYTKLVFGEAETDKNGDYRKFSFSYRKSEFMDILHEKPGTQDVQHNLICKTVPLKSHTKAIVPVPTLNNILNFKGPELTVFNSTSFAFGHLVSLFENEGKLESWMELYENLHGRKLRKETRRILEKFLRLGYTKNVLSITPDKLKNLPDIFQYEKEWDILNKKVKLLACGK